MPAAPYSGINWATIVRRIFRMSVEGGVLKMVGDNRDIFAVQADACGVRSIRSVPFPSLPWVRSPRPMRGSAAPYVIAPVKAEMVASAFVSASAEDARSHPTSRFRMRGETVKVFGVTESGQRKGAGADGFGIGSALYRAGKWTCDIARDAALVNAYRENHR